MSFIIVSFLVCSALAEYAPVMLNVDKNLVLSSVYDAIRENGDRALSIEPIDGRNKRNINYYTYDDYKNEELVKKSLSVVIATN